MRPSTPDGNAGDRVAPVQIWLHGPLRRAAGARSGLEPSGPTSTMSG